MRVNAVFEGGGVKAIGLAGAVSEAEKRGVDFHQVAGTSSGSIVASLLAAGYTGNDMKTIIMNTPFQRFLKKSWIHQVKWVGPVFRLFIKKGLYAGEELEQWIYKLLLAKGIRTFGDLRKGQLKIIASDITMGRLLVLPDDIARYGIQPEHLTVAKAVRMSTSIPYFFEPVIIRKNAPRRKGESFSDQFVHIVDGGLLSNFPLWIFDQKQRWEQGARPLPTLGFQLVGRGGHEGNKIIGPLTMLQALFSTMMDAHDERYIEEHKAFRTIKIPTLDVHTTEFDLSKEKSLALYEAGQKAAAKFLDKWSYESYLEKCKAMKVAARAMAER
ncbi:patatin-like phospholipase family protein [Paenibacillus senegalensis]|uniref:patatin-like phospholipase family protein n=1 Tax=Paenibacillus senegalensis TaxID=1465766 RepID=UPI0002896098|nr:patatin-like phospholipase family protein [Paenibacillus senegalensis]